MFGCVVACESVASIEGPDLFNCYQKAHAKVVSWVLDSETPDTCLDIISFKGRHGCYDMLHL